MEFIGNLDPSNQKDYQSIYSSQLYGTFFSLFAKFYLSEEDDHENANYYVIDKIKLKIINYKGILDIGISQAFFTPTVDGGIIKIEVQGANTKDFDEVDCKKHQFIKGNSYLKIDRRLKRLNESINPMKDGIFDKEFYYREGLFNSKDPDRTKPKQTEWDETVAFNTGGSICPFSKNKIV